MKRSALLISFVLLVAATACTPTGANPSTTVPSDPSGLREVYLPSALGKQFVGNAAVEGFFGRAEGKSISIDSANYPSGAVLSVKWVEFAKASGHLEPTTACVELANGVDGPALTEPVCTSIDMGYQTLVVNLATPLLAGEHTYVVRTTSPDFVCVPVGEGLCGIGTVGEAAPRISW